MYDLYRETCPVFRYSAIFQCISSEMKNKKCFHICFIFVLKSLNKVNEILYKIIKTPPIKYIEGVFDRKEKK